MGGDAFVVLRDGMRKSKVAAISRTVLFRRMRTVLIRPHGKGLIATTLNYDYEVHSSKKAFEEMPKLNLEGEQHAGPRSPREPDIAQIVDAPFGRQTRLVIPGERIQRGKLAEADMALRLDARDTGLHDPVDVT
ncbi:hypothetical protein AGR6A_pTi0203 [Agrobacterium sp. NCPPB 925]|nr:hypothetical protein AGR6A_pTi0203 [Agrobacterium sp. NCPPB 925]